MNKYMWIGFLLLLLQSCSSTKSDIPSESESERVSVIKNQDEHSGFIPEHISKSTIEVVPHPSY